MRAFLALLLLLAPAALSPARAAGLYEARTIVTGMDGRSRPEGLRRTLAQVLAKVSGNPALADDPRLAAMDPAPLLRAFAYLDRMSDHPKRDEQGTRDRPYDLVARFDPAAIDALLRQWGDAPWPAPRPTIAAQVVVTPRSGPPLPVRADTDADERHRAALLDAADRFGLDLVLPASLAPVEPPPGSPVLQGTLRWSDVEAGWTAEWHLGWGGGTRRWGLRGAGFDAAYRDAMAGVAAALSGHAGPIRE